MIPGIKKKYNKIIWISLDTLRSDCILFNKDKIYPAEYKIKIKLENSKLDELCSRGCFFSNVISVAPYTSASHAAYFTGLWPKNNGLYDQFNSKLSAKTVFQMAKKAGYKTIFKTDFPFILGKYLNIIGGVDEYIIEDNESILTKIKENKKVFSFIHFGQIHYPYGFHNLAFGKEDYSKKVEQLEKKYGIESEKINLEDMAIETFRTKEDLNLLYRYKKIIHYLYVNKKDDDLFNLYLEGINYFHTHLLNEFLENLMKMVKEEDYLIIISSDHGEAWNDGTYGHHNSSEEGVIKVPILFLAKDIKAMVYSNRIRTIDVTPTLNELLFGSKEKFDGKTLAPIIYKNETQEDRFAFSAVWVNESADVLKKVKRLLKEDKLSTQREIGVKYSATAYDKNYKYTVNYKKFSNRSEHLISESKESLFLIENFTTLKPIGDIEKSKQLKDIITRCNDIKIQKTKSKKEIMKTYFNLMGYKI
jgi:predicted AlkP superfamily pyrophosphatase or phosphodiesterase